MFRQQIIQGMLSELVIIRNDICHSAAVTHIIALDGVATGANLTMRGNIFCKAVQLLAYAEDTDVVERSQAALKEAFNKLGKGSKGEIHLKINEGENKYLLVTKRDCRYSPT
jgi:hypothetical protein